MFDWKPDYYVYDTAMFKKIFLIHSFLFLFLNSVFAESVKKINVSGNERISKETIILFGEIDLNSDQLEFDFSQLEVD